MKTQFEIYKPRKIHAQELIRVHDWQIKVYSITRENTFSAYSTLEAVEQHLPTWLSHTEGSEIPVYNVAFLIVHEAREGVWLLFNWWTGGEMIETKVYFADYKSSTTIQASPYKTSSLLCVWELEVFAHERKAWIKHILSQPNNPDFENYLKDTLTH